ncbi:MAG TPA: hypothetical protein VKB09_10110, partial [Thermomicrobiales bacterium]|nr:hypothetical protein [Thermomicrobiales bacterium]
RHRMSGALLKLLTFVFVASLVAVPAARVGARQQDDDAAALAEDVAPAQALVAEALQDGAIDYETSLLYRAYALFDDPRLPADFAGGGSFGEDNSFFGQVKYNWASLSTEAQKILTPFVVRPTSSQSIYYTSLADGPRALPNAEAAPTYAQGDCTDNWVSKDSAAHDFKVWTHCTGDYEADLDEAIRITDDFWEREVEFMGPPILDTGSAEQGGDTRIDVYFVDDEADRVERRGGDYISEDALAHAAPDNPIDGRKSSGYIVARRPNIGDPKLQLTMAHEFFHVLQDAHNWEIAFGFKGTPYNSDFETLSFSEFWFVEATADWVISHLYRDAVDFETMFVGLHSVFISGFQGYDVPLYYSPPQWSERFIHVYGAYVYFLFLEQEVGADAIAQMWRDLENVAPDDFERTTQVINDILPFKDHFRDFTLRNLDLDLLPGDPISPSYRDFDPTFPEGFAPPTHVGDSPTSRIELGIGRTEPWVFDDPIPSLSAHYFNFNVFGPVTRVTFDFTGLTDLEDVDVDMVTKIRQQGWELRRLDPAKPITFCREINPDAIVLVYLVVTNHDMEEANAVRGSFTVTSDEEPCGPPKATPAP